MRIATQTLIDHGIRNMLERQTLLAKVTEQISSGKRMQTAAHDPAGWSLSLSYQQAVSELDRYQGNVGTARQRLSLEETALASSSDVLARVRELAIQANNGTLDTSARKAIAAEMTQLRDQLLSYANTRDANGSHIFGGSNSGVAAFSPTNGSVVYNGDQNQRLLDIGPGRQIADGDHGDAVFRGHATGNGRFTVAANPANTGLVQLTGSNVLDSSVWDGGDYTITFNGGTYEVTDSASTVIDSGAYAPGQSIRFRGIELTLAGAPANGDSLVVSASQQTDVFATLDAMIAWAQQPTSTAAQKAQKQTELYGLQSELAQAFDRVNDVRSQVGVRLSALDDADNSLNTQRVALKTAQSGVEDMDLAEASSELTKHSLMLQAAQMAYAKVQGLSLFSFLK